MTDTTDFKYLFPIRKIPKIHGEPTYATLQVLKDALKTNASSISSDLGGGQHGHLVTVLSDPQYAHVSLVPYVRPGHPGPLVIPVCSTARQESTIREDHKRDTKLFHITADIERDLKSQIEDTIDAIYLGNIRDPVKATFQRF